MKKSEHNANTFQSIHRVKTIICYACVCEEILFVISYREITDTRQHVFRVIVSVGFPIRPGPKDASFHGAHGKEKKTKKYLGIKINSHDLTHLLN